MTRQSAMSIYRAYSLQSIRKQMGERWAIFFYSHHPYISIYLSLLAVALLNYAQANCIMMQQQRVERATLCHKCHHRCSPCNGNAMQSACKESRKKKIEKRKAQRRDEWRDAMNEKYLSSKYHIQFIPSRWKIERAHEQQQQQADCECTFAMIGSRAISTFFLYYSL